MHDQILAAIETLYDCVGDEYDHASALQTYSKLADDSIVILADMNIQQKQASRIDSYNFLEGEVECFTMHYDCPTRDKLLATFGELPPRVPILRRSVIPENEWLKSKMYEMGAKPWGLHGEGASYISKNLLTRTFCFFARHPQQRPIDTETFSIMAILNSHLDRAMGFQKRINRLEETLMKSSSVLDLIEFGLVLYGEDRASLFVNAAAQRILDAGDGLRLQKNSLIIGDRNANDRFQALIEAIYQPNLPMSQKSGGIISIPRLSRSRPYSLMVVPMQSRKVSVESVTTAVFLFDPDVRKATAIELFVSSYGLTRAESELAHSLALGATLGEIVDQRGVSRNTLKTQLQSIFVKTETSQQSELVSLLLRSVVGINLAG